MTRFLFPIFLFFCFLPSPQLQAQNSQIVPVSEKSSRFAKKIHIDGVKDAGKLNAHLYRGTQPNKKGMHALKAMGVTMIVDLRGEFRKGSTKEKKLAESLGMKFVLIPGNGWSPPTDEQMAQFFAIIAHRPEHIVFVHCWLGGDRTGVFLAAYRIAFEHWTPEQALEEMHVFHFKAFWHPAMKSYIKGFPHRLATSPALAEYRKIGTSAVVLQCSSPSPVLLSQYLSTF
jgi:tyrosine-protein phosphatase SIW14